MSKNQKIEGVREVWNKYKFVVLIVLIGIVLLLWPSGAKTGVRNTGNPSSHPELQTIQSEMEQILSEINGVGTVHVMLTEESDGELQLAQNTELSYSGSTEAPEDYSRRSEVVLANNGDECAIVTRSSRPAYRGALVVCQGGDRAEIRLEVTAAVTALTGLSSDRVTVAKCQ